MHPMMSMVEAAFLLLGYPLRSEAGSLLEAEA
jgi:hypothetical protein